MQDVAIVTGHTSGLGAAMAAELLARGYQVVGVARRAASHPAVEGLVAIAGDVAQQTTVDAAFEAAARLGRVRMVVNAAGVGVFGEVGSHTVADIQTSVQGSLVGLIAFSERAVAAMREEGGTLVNIMSTASKKLRPYEAVYTAAKWGAKAYTRTIREAVKGKKWPIRVVEVYPCGMATPFWRDAIRPDHDGGTFPLPGPIARQIVEALFSGEGAYQQEMVFERA